MPRPQLVALCTGVYLALSLLSFVVGGALAMAELQGGESSVPAGVAFIAMRVLLFPVVIVVLTIAPGLGMFEGYGGYALFLINSTICGAVIAWLWTWWRERQHRGVSA